MKKAAIVIFLCALIPLAYSVAASGLGYMYDADEMARVHETYLIATGHMPYRDYYTIYSPIFPFLMLPVFLHQGFTFAAVDTMRFIMVALFFLRVGAIAYVVHQMFGLRMALLFTAIYLLDPFTVFTSMQIRSDNLMVFILAIGLIFLQKCLRYEHKWSAGIAGGILALALCIMVKAFLTIGALALTFLIYAFFAKKLQLAKAFVGVGVFIGILYILTFFFLGTLESMFQQTILDPKAFLSTLDYPTPLGFFYNSGNWNLFGSGGKSPVWLIAWLLPVIGFAGMYLATQNFIERKEKKNTAILVPALGLSLALQWGLLFTLQSVFLQYYIPVMWLLAFFAAYAIDSQLRGLEKYRNIGNSVKLILSIIFLIFATASFKANILRSKLDSHDFINLMNKVWSYIPPDAKVFPMTYFRPPGYPLAEGYFAGVHSGLLDRYPAVETYLEKDKIPYVLASDYTIGYLKGETQAYIRSKYTKITSGFDLMKRTETINTAQQ